MTFIHFDGEKVEFQIEKGDTLLDVLLLGQDKVWGANRSILSIKVADEEVDPLTEEHLKTVLVEDKDIHLELSEPGEEPTLEKTIDEGIAYLSLLLENLEELAERIRNPEHAAVAQTDFKNTLEGLATILDLVKLIQGHPKCTADMQEQIESLVNEFLEILQESNESQEAGDPSMVGDLIEFEFTEMVEQLRDVLQIFRETF